MRHPAVTLFSIPAPFEGHTGVIQRNAIKSWRSVVGAEVLLFGDEAGLAETAREFGASQHATMRRNALGTPLVTDALHQARELANTDQIAYANADIILMSDFADAVSALERSSLTEWLMVGQRWDLDVQAPLDLNEPHLRSLVAAHGRLHGKAGIDYFAFPRHLPLSLPDMAVGRPGWDSYLIYAARAARIPVIDATQAVVAIHQNHPPRYRSGGAEAVANRVAAGGYFRMGTIRDADWSIDADLTLKKRLAGRLSFNPMVRTVLAAKRALLD